MQISEAITMLEKISFQNQQPEIWADLGCGSGTFTQALAHLLPPQSQIYAIDKMSQSLSNSSQVDIFFIKSDFEKEDLELPSLDGIMMANSLHYIEGKVAFLKKIKKHFKNQEQFIFIEYDTNFGNSWVPYPISFEKLKGLLEKMGFENIVKVGERKSVYSLGNMYVLYAKV